MDNPEMNMLYRQNLALGHRINALTNENNFYRIQINNFNVNLYLHEEIDKFHQ